MQFSTKFDIEQRVRIIEIAQPAMVIEIKYDGVHLIYNLEYWWNGEIKSVWLFERELAALKECGTGKTRQPTAQA